MSAPAPFERRGLEAAIGQAQKSLARGADPDGSPLRPPDETMVATRQNQRIQHNDPPAHGEMDCSRNAGRRRAWHTLTLATTLSPCAMCSGTVVLHQIRRIVIGENRTFQGREDWIAQSGAEVVVLDDPRCIAMMEAFIAANPALWNEDIGLPE